MSISVHTILQFCVREYPAYELKKIDVEVFFIEITFCSFSGGRNVIIGCVYWPSDTDIGSFNEVLGSTFDRINMENCVFY